MCAFSFACTCDDVVGVWCVIGIVGVCGVLVLVLVWCDRRDWCVVCVVLFNVGWLNSCVCDVFGVGCLVWCGCVLVWWCRVFVCVRAVMCMCAGCVFVNLVVRLCLCVCDCVQCVYVDNCMIVWSFF